MDQLGIGRTGVERLRTLMGGGAPCLLTLEGEGSHPGHLVYIESTKTQYQMVVKENSNGAKEAAVFFVSKIDGVVALSVNTRRHPKPAEAYPGAVRVWDTEGIFPSKSEQVEAAAIAHIQAVIRTLNDPVACKLTTIDDPGYHRIR
jgi:hypothetical protein